MTEFKVTYSFEKQQQTIVQEPANADASNHETAKTDATKIKISLEKMQTSLESIQTHVNAFLTEKLRQELGTVAADAKETQDLDTDSE